MVDPVDLSTDEQQVLQAVSRLEAEDDTATVRRVADVTGIEVRRAEQLLGRLAATHDLLRERRTELDPEAAGHGREYVVKARPSP